MKDINFVEQIRVNFPEIEISEVEYNYNGQNNHIVLINNKYIFRFPKYFEGIDRMKNEINLLKILGKHVSIPIPYPEFLCYSSNEPGKVFWGYKILKGEPFTKQNLSTLFHNVTLGKQLGNFLKELHSIPLEHIKGIRTQYTFEKSYWEDIYKRIREKLFDYMNSDKRRRVEENFNNYLENGSNFEYESVLIHGDFGISNILYDKDTGNISGIIDFGSSKIGDPAIDIASLFGAVGYKNNLLLAMEEVYPEIRIFINRALFYKSTFALQEALFGLENRDKQAFENGISGYM